MHKNFNKLTRFLAHTSDVKVINQFLNELLTPAEIADLDSRLEIIKLLEQGVTQRRIASKLHVSLCKITRGSKELKKDESCLRDFVQSINVG